VTPQGFWEGERVEKLRSAIPARVMLTERSKSCGHQRKRKKGLLRRTHIKKRNTRRQRPQIDTAMKISRQYLNKRKARGKREHEHLKMPGGRLKGNSKCRTLDAASTEITQLEAMGGQGKVQPKKGAHLSISTNKRRQSFTGGHGEFKGGKIGSRFALDLWKKLNLGRKIEVGDKD